MITSTSIFNLYSRYYDLLYIDKDYDGEAKYIHKLLAKFGVQNGNLLEFGSGTGKHGRLLAELGYLIHGIERSAQMVKEATNNTALNNGFTCQQGNICHVSMGRTYDAVVSLFHVISYQISNEDLNAVFARAAEHTKPYGLFIFDFWYGPAVYAQRPSVRIKRMSDKLFEITRIAEPIFKPNENRVDVNFTIFARDLTTGALEIFNENHSMRFFSLPEIDLIAKMHGFERIAVEEFFTGKSPDENTWGVCVVLKKIK